MCARARISACAHARIVGVLGRHETHVLPLEISHLHTVSQLGIIIKHFCTCNPVPMTTQIFFSVPPRDTSQNQFQGETLNSPLKVSNDIGQQVTCLSFKRVIFRCAFCIIGTRTRARRELKRSFSAISPHPLISYNDAHIGRLITTHAYLIFF